MAPQNSTLIHELHYVDSMMMASTSELSRFSPILPITEENGGNNDNNSVHRKKSICSRAINIQEDDDDVGKGKCNNGECITDIPIWICGEPRFISGITCTTTCYEIIQALIDDELHNGFETNAETMDVAASRDRNDYMITEKWRDVEQALTGETHILPIWEAWGSARNEVKFKLKINKNKVGHYALERKLLNEKDSKPRKNLVSKLLKRLMQQSEAIYSILGEKTKGKTHYDILQLTTQKTSNNNIQKGTFFNEPRMIDEIYINPGAKEMTPQQIQLDPDDELFLLIENADENDMNSGVHVEYRQYLLNKKLAASQKASNFVLNISNISLKTIDTTPKRKMRTKQYFERLRQRGLCKKLFNSFSPNKMIKTNVLDHSKITENRYKYIQYEIQSRLNELNNLKQYKNELKANLAKCSAQYRAQNELYTTNLGLQICIEKIQASLELYSKEIIKNEYELFTTKMEIEEKRGILKNLQRMFMVEEQNETLNGNEIFTQMMPIMFEKSKEICHTDYQLNEINFVDNIYEFCDNNESIIV